MTVALAALAGGVTAHLLWRTTRPVFDQPLFLRQNYRGADVPTGCGIVVVLAVIGLAALRVAFGMAGVGERPLSAGHVAVLVAVAGFGVLGLIDDVAGSGNARGFRGHLHAMARGRLTTGGLKLVGGGAVALIVAGLLGNDLESNAQLVVDAGVLALAANLGNLLDRAPGRSIKCGVAAFALLAVLAGERSLLTAPAVAVGAAAGLLLDDLRERLMLGDAGANVLGAAVGLGVLLACAPVVRVAVLIVLVVANLTSEVVSFSRVIEGVPPLRALDRAGRRRPEGLTDGGGER
jgi:UDP-GlcNAc:undecaprenyl-phosphate/decaprenyl-phosphate GlcNAc-1-phosphate transferase